MHQIFVGLGSNHNREQNLRLAIGGLRAAFGSLDISPVYQTDAVGFKGEDFYNLVVAFQSDNDAETILTQLHQIEDRQGRDRSQPKYSSRSIDLDLLLFDHLVVDKNGVKVPRGEILFHAFVLRPLFDLAPDLFHPVEQRSYTELWQEMAPNAGKIIQVPLIF